MDSYLSVLPKDIRNMVVEYKEPKVIIIKDPKLKIVFYTDDLVLALEIEDSYEQYSESIAWLIKAISKNKPKHITLMGKDKRIGFSYGDGRIKINIGTLQSLTLGPRLQNKLLLGLQDLVGLSLIPKLDVEYTAIKAKVDIKFHPRPKIYDFEINTEDLYYTLDTELNRDNLALILQDCKEREILVGIFKLACNDRELIVTSPSSVVSFRGGIRDFLIKYLNKKVKKQN